MRLRDRLTLQCLLLSLLVLGCRRSSTTEDVSKKDAASWLAQEPTVRRDHTETKSIRRDGRADSVRKVIPANRFVRFGDIVILIHRWTGPSEFEDIRIQDLREPEICREIHGASGKASISQNGRNIVLDISKCRIHPFSVDVPKTVYVDEWLIEIEDAVWPSQDWGALDPPP